MQIHLKDTFNKELEADKNTTNTRRQVQNACFSFVAPKQPKQPKLVHLATDFAATIGLLESAQSTAFLEIFSGSKVYPNTNPFAMCYGGHQFGSWAGQLGDGRAINLFEMEYQQKRWALQLKGAGETPYSRNADGLAVLRSSIREHLCSEAMHYLGVPTTRSLSLVLSGDTVLRDVLYNGNPAYEKGAIVCRAAPSFIRFGNFEILAARNDTKNLKKLADYTIKHFFATNNLDGKEKYVQFYKDVVQQSLEMVVQWQRVGFVHGVMNTDNMSVLGLTIDYGPYGWLENFDLNWTPNTTDAGEKRYRFGNQPNIVLWNLMQLGNALYPLIEDIDVMQSILDSYHTNFTILFREMIQNKLGLEAVFVPDFYQELLTNFTASETDFTIFYRNLATINKADTPKEALLKVENAFYFPKEVQGKVKENWLLWLAKYIEKINLDERSDANRKEQMNQTNPKYVLRNYMAQLAIDAAEKEDYSVIEELYQLLQKPYNEQPENEKWFAKRPDWAREKIGCSMLSCSS